MATETITVELAPTPDQQHAIEATFEAFAAARDEAMRIGHNARTAGYVVLQRLCYPDLRASYGLSANLTVRAIGQAAQQLREPGTAYRAGEPTIDYDNRVFSLDRTATRLSLSTVAGRIRGIRVEASPEQRRRLRRGRSVRAVLSRTAQGAYRLAICIEPREPGQKG